MKEMLKDWSFDGDVRIEWFIYAASVFTRQRHDYKDDQNRRG